MAIDVAVDPASGRIGVRRVIGRHCRRSALARSPRLPWPPPSRKRSSTLLGSGCVPYPSRPTGSKRHSQRAPTVQPRHGAHRMQRVSSVPPTPGSVPHIFQALGKQPCMRG